MADQVLCPIMTGDNRDGTIWRCHSGYPSQTSVKGAVVCAAWIGDCPKAATCEALEGERTGNKEEPTNCDEYYCKGHCRMIPRGDV